MVRLAATSLLILFTEIASASPVLKAEFASTFYTHYVEGKCGQNTINLLKRAQDKGVDLSNARIVKIENGGYFLSVTHRRNAGERLANSIGDIRFAPGIKNFYFHVALEKDGEIYDFDFGNEPQVISTKEYVRRMFWEEPAKTEYTGLERLSLRKDYKISFIPANSYLIDESAEPVSQHDLSDYYDSLK